MRLPAITLTLMLAPPACAPKRPADPAPVARPAPAPAPAPPSSGAAAAARAEQDRRIARLELQLLEKDAQIDALQARLDETRQEVVRAMAKLQTLATRAEAASAIAEAEVALQPLKAGAGGTAAPEAAQAAKLLRESSAEFDKQNYGGALYLANQAKTVAAGGQARTGGARAAQRPGEVAFALPIPLKATAAGNVRQAPGTAARVAFGVKPGDSLTGYSYADEWIRIEDQRGRDGWIFRSLVTRR